MYESDRPSLIGVWDKSISSPLYRLANSNAGKGGTAADLVIELEDAGVMGAIAASREVAEGADPFSFVRDAHAKAVARVRRATITTTAALAEFRRLPLQPSAATATSDYQVLGSILGIAQASGKPIDRKLGTELPISERQIEVHSGVTRTTVRKAIRRLQDLGWLLTSTADSYHQPQSITVVSPWTLALSSETQVHTDHPNHPSLLSVVENMNGADPVQASELLGSHPIWSASGYGDAGRQIYAALLASEQGLTAADLYGGTAPIAHRNTVGSKLRKMAATGLVEKVGKRWFATGMTLDEAAADMGLFERQRKVRANAQRERENYRRVFPQTASTAA